MIEGHYGREEMGSDSDYFLESVSFPMKRTIPHTLDSGEDEVVIHNEEELKQWAEEVFVAHMIWDMEVPFAACRDEAIAYDLENAAERLEEDAYALRKEPLEQEIVQDYSSEARRLRHKASLLRGRPVPNPDSYDRSATT
jgi:hypothetical protein